MSARSKVSASDDQNLSLTGSQISTSLRKSSSAKQLHNIGTTPVTGSELKSTSKSGNGSRKKMPSFSSNAVPLSNRSEMSDISSVSQQKSRRSTGRSPGEDFMALFENTMQPKIKKPSSKSKKPSPNAVKVLWNPSNKGDGVDSQRSLLSQTPDSERDDLLTTPKHHNFFNPPGGSSSDEEQDEMAKILSSSLSKLNAIQKKAMEEASKRSKQNKDSNSKLPSKNFLSHSQQSGINGIANNMVTNVKTPKTKASFSTLENSYQNIRHKTPVNQVKEEQLNHKPQNKIGQDYSDSKYGIAASKIQRWYLQLKKRKQEKEMVRPEPSRKAGEAAIKRLLQQKKEEFEDHRLNLDFLSEGENEKSKAEDRKKMREEKARQARQEAIKDLQKKREEKKEESKRKAEEEISFLQANGKITKHPMKSNIGRKKHSREDKQKKDSNMEVQSVSDGGHQSSRSNLTGQPDEVDEFIESLSNVQNLSSGRNSEGGHTDRSNTLVNTEVTTKSTLNDLLSTLKKLEEEEHFLTPKAEKKTAWLDEIEKDLEQGTDSRRETTLTEDRLQEMNSRQGDETSEKMQSIINFLDEVQTAERLSAVDQEISKISVADFEIPPPLVPSVDELADIEEASAAANEVTTSMLKQRLELEEKKRTVTMLQKALNQQRELTVRHARETEKEMKKRLDVQKDEYEEAIKRHLSFIDQLIDDKKTLGEKCEVLVRELKTVDKKYQDKLKGMEERHNVDLQKIKDMHEAAEKLRRERWIEDKTKKIKEMTVKGLEPEIQRLIAKHKSEVKKIKQIHEAELLESDERAAQRYVKMTEELREQLAHEKEAACARERELAKSRYEKELQNEEQAYQQQRRRLYQEVQEEKDRVAQQASRQRRELDSLQRQMEEAHRQAISAMKSEFDKAREEQENRHMTETRELKEKLKLEKEAFEENFMKKQDNWLLQKERELKEKVKKERDKEIELVINRLEEDATMSREETDRAAENKIKRLREKYDAEIKDLERSEMQALERYNDMKARLTEVEGENECMKVYLKQKDQEIEQLKKLTDKMHKERDRVSDIIRQEFADRLVATDEENKRIKNEISELKARHRIELDRMKDQIEEVRRQKDDEMEEVHKRVKQAIVKKEEVVNELKQQYQAAQKRADHLEGLLQQQRKQLLKK